MTPEAFAAFQAHAAACAPYECCGVIVGQDYHPCRNIAEGSGEFRLHPRDVLKAEKLGRMRAICHSHPGAACFPGKADREGCELTGLPWFILGVDGMHRLDPVAYRRRLEGRPFEWGWADCYSLVRDYFGATLPDFPRDKASAARLFADEAYRLGFRSVTRDELRVNDVVLMQILSPEGPNHAAVYVGGGQILHHMAGRLSCREFYDGSYQRATRLTLRRLG